MDHVASSWNGQGATICRGSDSLDTELGVHMPVCVSFHGSGAWWEENGVGLRPGIMTISLGHRVLIRSSQGGGGLCI